ncbi:MAG: ATP-binding cassette domain-containing protein [Neomegalonema sp.]|nr:ATP-binding cassette domain-containing protein [Neomegalonema sp.]
MSDARPELSLADLIGTERRALRLGSGVLVLANLLWIGQAASIAVAFERLSAPGAPVAIGAILLPVLCFLGLTALRLGLDAIGQSLIRAAASRIVTEARRALAFHLSIAALGAETLSSGAAAALGAEKLEMLRPALIRFEPARLRVAVVPLMMLAAVAWISWAAALVLLVAGPLIPLFMALIGMAAREESERQMLQIGSMNAVLLDRLRGLVDIRLMGAGERVALDFEQRAEGLRAQTMRVLRIAFLSSAVLELFAALGVAMIAVYIGFSLLGVLGFGSWGAPISLGGGLFVLMLAPEFFQPLRDFAAAWHDRAAARAVEAEFDALLAGQGARILGLGKRAAPLIGAGRITLEAAALRGLVLRQPLSFLPGERVALIGPSGAGKSTLLAAIAGLLPLEGGRIELDGVPLTQANADAWRARLAWIGQMPSFLSGSLRANVALAGSAADLPALEAALRRAQAQGIVARAPRGLDTRLGEAGEGVSGGEGRRLAIARAAFKAEQGAEQGEEGEAERGARLAWVLADEPTADLDAQTAAEVTGGLLALAQGGKNRAGLIVATHDPALIAAMDRVVDLQEVLQEGLRA